MRNPSAVPPGLRARLIERMLDGPVSLSFAPDESRFCLRVAGADRAAASDTFDLVLPTRIGERVRDGGRSALCLGPDEWVLYAPPSDAVSITDAFADLRSGTSHSLIDISDREIAVALEGTDVLSLLSVGCPADPRDVPVGEGRRTVFDGASVVLRRDAEHAFRMEVWRSFLPHVWDLLNTANRELSTGH